MIFKIGKRRIRFFFKRRIIVFIVKKKLLFLVKRIIIILFLIVVIVTRFRVKVTWSRVSIITSATCYFFRNTNRSEIEPITNKHEWKSVSFIRQSRSLHYGRLMLSKRQANILKFNIKVPKQIFNIDLDREEVNNNQLMIDNPLFEELNPDDLENEELVQVIDNPLFEELNPDDLEDEELVQ